MKITNELLKKQALEHYDRMIAWAKLQDQSKIQSSFDMQNNMARDLKENFFGIYCPYCQLYYAKKTLDEKEACVPCPLNTPCDLNTEYTLQCCNGLWGDMARSSKTWEEWIKKAERVKEYIETYGC